MADEKNLNETAEQAEEIIENVEETVEAAEDAAEAVEEATEAVEEAAEAVEDAAEEISEVDRAVAEALAQRDAQDAAAKAEKAKKAKVAAIIAAAVIVVAGVVCSGFVSKGADGGIRFNTYSGWLPKLVNKYNHMGYVDISGNTVGDIAESMGMNVADFLDQFELPEDMPASTHEMAAVYMLPAKSYASMYGLDFETMKEMLNIPDTTEDGEEITEDTTWGIVQGEVTVGDYVGDSGDGEALASFKEEYGFGDEITAETKWKEVRNIVDNAQRAARIESERAAREQSKVDESDADIIDIDDLDIEDIEIDDIEIDDIEIDEATAAPAE